MPTAAGKRLRCRRSAPSRPRSGGSFVAPWGFKHLKPDGPDEHIEDRMSEEAVAWMEQQVAADRPFYLQYTVDPTDNAPLRGGKATIWEGGIRVPTTFYWPEVTPPDGAVSDAVIQTTDFYPTILGLLGIPLPDGHPIDGLDFSAALRGGNWQRPSGMITYFPHTKTVPDWLPPSVSINDGDWKLIRFFYCGETPGEHQYLLFNLKALIRGSTRICNRPSKEVRLTRSSSRSCRTRPARSGCTGARDLPAPSIPTRVNGIPWTPSAHGSA